MGIAAARAGGRVTVNDRSKLVLAFTARIGDPYPAVGRDYSIEQRGTRTNPTFHAREQHVRVTR